MAGQWSPAPAEADVKRRRLVGVLTACMLALVGCADGRASEPAGALPDRVLPASFQDMTVKLEPSAQRAFASAGNTSLTARGSVWTLRRDNVVRGALQVGVLKPRFKTDDIDVRRGIRANIETGKYRWFKVEGQWVGVQDLPELELYLWFPPRRDLYEVLQFQPDVPDQKQLIAQILRFQKGSTS
jgi:hypothetical protein